MNSLGTKSHDSSVHHGDAYTAPFATADENVLPCKTRELIALGMCVVLGRDAYLIWRIEQAIKAGACEPEILEVARLAIEIAGENSLDSVQCALDTSKDILQRLANANREWSSVQSETEINP